MIYLKNCPKCGCSPELVCGGLAKSILDKDGEIAHTYYVDFDGYSVECSECPTSTKIHACVENAAKEWNNM